MNIQALTLPDICTNSLNSNHHLSHGLDQSNSESDKDFSQRSFCDNPNGTSSMHADATLAPTCGLETGDAKWGKSPEGTA